MKFLLEFVPMSRATRRRCGKARKQLIDTEADIHFRGVTDPAEIERRFEIKWDNEHPGSHSVLKVVDVREVTIEDVEQLATTEIR